MNKLTASVYLAQTIILSSLITSLGLLSLPLPSMADQEEFYRNCSELQKRLNERNNPRKKYGGFEKIKMMKRITGYEKYMVFCNGGVIVDREVGTICRGYIGYSFSRIGGGAHYYSAWGETKGVPNFNDTGVEKYCQLIK